MSDDFLTRLQGDWKAGDNDVEPVRRRLAQDLWRNRLILVGELAWAAVGFGAGLWMAARGLGHHDPLLLLGAAVLLASLPPLSLLSFLARRGGLHWEDVSPEGMVDYALTRLERRARLVRLTRWHLYVLGGFFLAIWALVLAGQVRPSGFVVAYSGVLLAMIGIGLPLLARQARRIDEERRRCATLRDDFQTGPDTGEI